LQGIVIKSTGSWYSVRLESGQQIDARIQGKFRIKGIKTTNPVAVGDHVTVKESEKDNFVIIDIKDRKNYIIRKSVNLSKRSHIIAANIDQALLIVTLSHPTTYTGFIDRFLISAEAYHIPTTIVFNKIDIYTEEEKVQLNNLMAIYTNIGYQCIAISALNKSNIETVKSLMKNKISVVSGHSGVGKSTLLNCIEPQLQLKTSEISESHSQGKHTTTFAEMFELNFGGYIIDTPGVKAFGLILFRNESIIK